MEKDEHNDENRPETLQERSARLEAEAAAFAAGLSPQEPNALKADEGADVTALQAELGAAKEQVLRALAEADNARKRAAREREDASKYAISNFARDLLSVADNLRRALEAAPPGSEQLLSLLQGVEATERELLKIFEKNGIRKIEPAGEMFNPNFHEVMFEAPATGQPAGTIVQVIEAGYVLNDRLLRPARVGVAKDDGSASAAHSVDQQV